MEEVAPSNPEMSQVGHVYQFSLNLALAIFELLGPMLNLMFYGTSSSIFLPWHAGQTLPDSL